MSEPVRIRPFRPGDEPALMEVCLRTGDAGGDASDLLEDPDLLSYLWLLPYLRLAPELASVVVDAAATGDRTLALQALLLDPMINDIDRARAILDDFLVSFQEWLPQFWG